MENLNNSVPNRLILIGASTGGPGEIQKIIESLPKLQNTSLIIGQHMVDGFLDSFASRLQDSSKNPITVPRDREVLLSERIYICEGETEVIGNSHDMVFKKNSVKENSFNPDINRLFNSLVPFSKKVKILCVILTGIGDDGVDACHNLSRSGAKCLTQNEKSAIVDGMPSRVRSLVPEVGVHTTSEIIELIKEFS